MSSAKKFSKTELFVRDSLVRAGWTFLFHDIQIFGVQVDLLLRGPGGTLTLIEVKTGSGLTRLGGAQRRRLLRVSTFLAQFEPVDLKMAIVTRLNLRLLPVDSLTGE